MSVVTYAWRSSPWLLTGSQILAAGVSQPFLKVDLHHNHKRLAHASWCIGAAQNNAQHNAAMPGVLEHCSVELQAPAETVGCQQASFGTSHPLCTAPGSLGRDRDSRSVH